MKRSFGILSAILLMAFTCSSFAQQIESGTFFANSKTAGYTLNANKGDRSVSIEVTFTEPFKVKPNIVISVSQIEAGNDARVRYNVSPQFISRDGFIIKISTWSESKIYQIGGGWVAVSK